VITKDTHCLSITEDVRKQEKEEGIFKRGELPGQFIARKLFG